MNAPYKTIVIRTRLGMVTVIAAATFLLYEFLLTIPNPYVVTLLCYVFCFGTAYGTVEPRRLIVRIGVISVTIASALVTYYYSFTYDMNIIFFASLLFGLLSVLKWLRDELKKPKH